MLLPSSVLDILKCPVCQETLRVPTTLLCGHSLCSHHLQAPSSSCPVRGCAENPLRPVRPRIPAESTVRYTPAPNIQPEIQDPAEQRPDVTLTALVNLASRTARHLDDPLRPQIDSDSDDETDDDDTHSSHNDPPPASTAHDTTNEGPSSRPRKRHKRSHVALPEPEPEEDEEELDLLSHLRSTATMERRVPPDEPLISIPPPSTDPSGRDTILTEFDKKLLEELSCHICYVLFYQPVTTPCQHTFCAKCLQRSLDHSITCPICRKELPSYYFQDQPVNKTILSIILQGYPILYEERGAAIAEDERHSRLNTPIFVCQLSFPGVPTVLHFFEPRYRLMLRRCLELPNPRFGMVMSPKPGAPQADYGTMLEIKSVQMFPDGRSMVETFGFTRFRILERGTLDGYMVGRIEKIDDYADDLTERLMLDDLEATPIPSRRLRPDQRLFRRIAETLTRPSPVTTPPMREISSATGTSIITSDISVEDPATDVPESRHPRHPTNEELISTCKSFLDRLQRGAAPWVVQRLSSTYGTMPTDPALFSFWVALVLPLEEHEKAKLLPIRSARLRLMLVVHWIEQLNNNWYAWLHFVIWHGWINGGPALPCLLWIAFVLTFFRLIGWI